jgi:protein TonB
MEGRRFTSLRSSISISVGFHVLFFVAWALLFGQQAAKNTQRRDTIWIEMDPVAKARKLQKKESERIVQTGAGQPTKSPAPDAHLGERDQVVDRQTVSAKRTTVMGEQARAAKPTARERAEAQKQQEESVLPTPTLSQLGVPILPMQRKNALTDAGETGPMNPGATPQDYIKGLKEGERTALNTREYVFYGYFQRIRQRLDLAWTSSLREQLMRLYRGGRQLASDMDHTTRLLVTLNSGGEIVKVDVLEESGTKTLDDAAVRAFNRAGPFPNPPNGIVDRNGQIQIRWEFVLKT